MMRWRWIATILFFAPHGTLYAEPKLEQFFAQHCVKCHGPKKPKGKVRLDRQLDALFSDLELLETVTSVLEAGDMPAPYEAGMTVRSLAGGLLLQGRDAAVTGEELKVVSKRTPTDSEMAD